MEVSLNTAIGVNGSQLVHCVTVPSGLVNGTLNWNWTWTSSFLGLGSWRSNSSNLPCLYFQKNLINSDAWPIYLLLILMASSSSDTSLGLRLSSWFSGVLFPRSPDRSSSSRLLGLDWLDWLPSLVLALPGEVPSVWPGWFKFGPPLSPFAAFDLGVVLAPPDQKSN